MEALQWPLVILIHCIYIPKISTFIFSNPRCLINLILRERRLRNKIGSMVFRGERVEDFSQGQLRFIKKKLCDSSESDPQFLPRDFFNSPSHLPSLPEEILRHGYHLVLVLYVQEVVTSQRILNRTILYNWIHVA